MEHISSYFATTYEKGGTTYNVYGSFTALPESNLISKEIHSNVISVSFYINQCKNESQELPKARQLYIREVNGQFTSGIIKNQQFIPFNEPFFNSLEVVILTAYNNAIERKKRMEDEPAVDYSDLFDLLQP